MIYTLGIYNLIWILSSSFAYLASKSRGKNELLFRTVTFLVLFIPAAIRYRIGTDYRNYVDMFHSSLDLEKTEIAYRWLNEFVKFCHFDVQWVFIVSAFFMYFPICFLVKKRWLFHIITFFVLFFYLKSYSLVRQSIAVCFLLVTAIDYLENKNLLKMILGMGLASSFHVSAILFLPALLLRNIRLSFGLSVLIISVLFFCVKNGLADSIFTNELFLESAYGTYAESMFNREAEIGSGMGILIRFAVPLFLLYYARKIDKKFSLIVIGCIAYIFAYLLAIQIHIFNRLVDLYSFVPILAYAAMAFTVLKVKRKILIALLLINFLNFQKTIIYSKSSLHEGLGITPYTTIFDK